MFPVWVACNLILGFACWKLARRWFYDDSIFALLMHTLILSWAFIAVASFAIGVAGMLTGPGLMTVTTIAAVFVLLGLQFLYRNKPPTTPTSDESEIRWLWFWLTILSLWIGHVVSSGLLKFPTDWDTLHYHLPMIVQWLHAGSLYAPDCCQWSFPGNNEIIGFWIVAPFSGDYLISLNNLPATVLLACATVDVGKKLGLTPTLLHLTTFAVVSNYIVLNQLLDASNDVAVAGLFVACISYGFRVAKGVSSQNFSAVLLFAISLGLLAGVKFYALGYAALAGTAFFLFIWKRQGWRRAQSVALLCAAGLVVFGGYWYLRNAWVTGSPLYPKSFQPEADVMAKIYPDIGHTSFLGNGRPELFELAVKAIWQMAGPCHVAAFVLLPLTLLWITISALLERKRQRLEIAEIRWTFAFLVAGALGVIVITPFAVEDEPGTLNQMHWYYCPVRYGISFLTLAVLALALVLQEILARNRLVAWLPTAFFLVGGAFQAIFQDQRLNYERTSLVLIAGNLVLVATNWFVITRLWPSVTRALLLIFLVGFLVAGAWGVGHLAKKWHRDFAPFYDQMLSPGTFTLLKDEQPDRCICVLDHRAYPFFGSRRQFRVCQPVYVPSSPWLIDYFHEQDVCFVASRPKRQFAGWHLFDHFNESLHQNPAVFQPIHKDRDLVLFRVAAPGP